MVADEGDDGVVAQAELIELGQDAADVVIDPGNRGDVGADDLLGFGDRRGAADEKVGVARADGGLWEAGRDRGPGREVGSQFDFVEIIEVVKLFRRGGGAVGLGKAASDEKGLIFVFVEVADDGVGGMIVAVAFAHAVEEDHAVGFRRAAYILRQRRGEIGGLGGGNLSVGGGLEGMAASAAGAFENTIANVPGLGVVDAAVIDLTAANDGVAILAEELREADVIGMFVAEAGGVAKHAGGRGMTSGEEGRARGIAQRELAIVAVEMHAGFGEGVEDVGFARRGGGCGGCLRFEVPGKSRDNDRAGSLSHESAARKFAHDLASAKWVNVRACCVLDWGMVTRRVCEGEAV